MAIIEMRGCGGCIPAPGNWYSHKPNYKGNPYKLKKKYLIGFKCPKFGGNR